MRRRRSGRRRLYPRPQGRKTADGQCGKIPAAPQASPRSSVKTAPRTRPQQAAAGTFRAARFTGSDPTTVPRTKNSAGKAFGALRPFRSFPAPFARGLVLGRLPGLTVGRHPAIECLGDAVGEAAGAPPHGGFGVAFRAEQAVQLLPQGAVVALDFDPRHPAFAPVAEDTGMRGLRTAARATNGLFREARVSGADAGSPPSSAIPFLPIQRMSLPELVRVALPFDGIGSPGQLAVRILLDDDDRTRIAAVRRRGEVPPIDDGAVLSSRPAAGPPPDGGRSSATRSPLARYAGTAAESRNGGTDRRRAPPASALRCGGRPADGSARAS